MQKGVLLGLRLSATHCAPLCVHPAGSGEAAHHLILELYAAGNIVLMDASFTVLTLLRSHRDDAGGLQVMPRHGYPLAATRPFAHTPREALVAALRAPPPEAPAAAPAAPAAPAPQQKGGRLRC